MNTGSKPPRATDIPLHSGKPARDSSRSHDFSDTHWMVTGRENESLVVGTAGSNEILDVLVDTLNRNPERVDLWMMRFEIEMTLGMKTEFAEAMRAGFSNKVIRRGIDWAAVRDMWNVLARGEPAPEGVLLPELKVAAVSVETTATIAQITSKSSSARRRFSDIAQQIAAPELEKLAQQYQALRSQPNFFMDYARRTRQLLKRPTPLQHAEALGRAFGGAARIFLKREDLHKDTPETEIAVAQAFIASSLGKWSIITGNDVDEYSLALATVAPQFKLQATIVVTPEDVAQKAAMMTRLRELGAKVEVTQPGEMIGSDPREGALRLWQKVHELSHLALSFGLGPIPYPRMVNDFQMLLGYESDLQLRAKAGADRPRTLVAATLSEADSIGFMLMYLKRPEVELYYADPDSAGPPNPIPSARFRAYHGAMREQAWLRATGRITYLPIPDAEAREAQAQVKTLEDVAISLEDARAVALAARLERGDNKDRDLVILVA